MNWFYTGLVIYILGFIAVLFINLNIGPVTPGLALLRAFLWPLWLFTGIPAGTRLPMD